MALTDKLTAIGDAIREKTDTTDLIPLNDMPDAIRNIQSGGGKFKPKYLSFYYTQAEDLSYELSNLDTSEMVTMEYMFGNTKLKTLDVRHFNTSKVKKMTNMFYCNSIGSISVPELDLSSFDTSNVTNMSSMFRNLSKTTKIDIRNFTFDNVTSYSNMFGNVKSSCLIIVKGDTEKEWITSKFTKLTNVKTVAEYEAEGGV